MYSLGNEQETITIPGETKPFDDVVSGDKVKPI